MALTKCENRTKFVKERLRNLVHILPPAPSTVLFDTCLCLCFLSSDGHRLVWYCFWQWYGMAYCLKWTCTVRVAKNTKYYKFTISLTVCFTWLLIMVASFSKAREKNVMFRNTVYLFIYICRLFPTLFPSVSVSNRLLYAFVAFQTPINEGPQKLPIFIIFMQCSPQNALPFHNAKGYRKSETKLFIVNDSAILLPNLGFCKILTEIEWRLWAKGTKFSIFSL